MENAKWSIHCRHMKAHGHGQVEAWVDLDSMDEPKLMATYFRNFDLDKNGRIDGLELLKSMQRMNGVFPHVANSQTWSFELRLSNLPKTSCVKL